MLLFLQTLPCARAMAPVVRAEPNGSQALLMFESAYSDLEEFGWLPFICKFDGFNPGVARQFSLTFDGFQAKVGDMQLEIDEIFSVWLPVCLLSDRNGQKIAKWKMSRGNYSSSHEG